MKKFKQKHFEKAMDFEIFLDHDCNGSVAKLLTYNPFHHEFSVVRNEFTTVYSDANLAISAYNNIG